MKKIKLFSFFVFLLFLSSVSISYAQSAVEVGMSVGQTTNLHAYYDPDGAGPLPRQDITSQSNWTSSYPAAVTVNNTTNKGYIIANQGGNTVINATYTDPNGDLLDATTNGTAYNITVVSASFYVSAVQGGTYSTSADIGSGNPVYLKWSTTNLGSCSIGVKNPSTGVISYTIGSVSAQNSTGLSTGNLTTDTTFAIVCSGTGGAVGISAQKLVTVTVNSFNFSISRSSGSVSVDKGASVTNTVTAFKTAGTTSQSVTFWADQLVTLLPSGTVPAALPAGITASFNPTSCTPNSLCNSTVTISVGPTVSSGTYTIRVGGTSATATGDTANFTLIVNAPVVPVVSLPTSASITQNSAVLGATVSSLGTPATISARGTCWGTTANPTTNCIPATGTTTGVYSHTRTGLSCGTTYYYRGYATNLTGTGYSTDSTFTTSGCTITSSAGANGSITPLGVTSKSYGTSQTYTIDPNPNYKMNVVVDGVSFGDLIGTYNRNTYTFSNITGNHTISVSFALNTYNINISRDASGGTITPNTSQTVNYGDTKSFVVVPSAGYKASTSGCGGSPTAPQTASYTYTTGPITSTCTVFATFLSGNISSSAPSCTIAAGASSCSVNLSWSTINSRGTSAVTSSYPSANTPIGSGNTGGPLSVTIPKLSSPRTFYLYNNGVELDQVSVTSDCITNTTWSSVSNTCAVNKYTVTFDGNGATGGSMTLQSITSGTPANLTLNSFTKTNYTFAGWNTSPLGSGTNYGNGASYTMGTANVTLYAMWTINPYTITFNGNGATGGSTATQTINSGSSANLRTNGFTNTGYTFAGWATSSSGPVVYANGQSYTMGTANVTLYAKWTLNTVLVSTSVSAFGGGTISPAPSVSVNYGSITNITVTPSPGYVISSIGGTCGGSLLADGKTYSTNSITSACTVIASFMSGTISSSAPSCVIAAGSSTCPVYLTWSTNNTPSGATSAVTASATTSPVTPQVNRSGNSGTSISFVVPFSTRTFYLYNNALELDQVTVTSSCATGSTWNFGTQTCLLNTYNVSSSGSNTHGTISPALRSAVSHGSTTTFTVTPSSGYLASASGCGGVAVSSSGTAFTYTTGPITASCTVTATFAIAPLPTVDMLYFSTGSGTENRIQNLNVSSTDGWLTGNTGIVWTSTGATSCAVSGDWIGSGLGVNSSHAFNPDLGIGRHSYTITCTGPGGTSVADTVTINVYDNTFQSVITANGTTNSITVASGVNATLNWDVLSGDSFGYTCSASSVPAGWSGTKAATGTEVIPNLTSTKTYKITCTNPLGRSEFDEVIVNVTPPAADLTITANISPITATANSAQTYTSVVRNIGNTSTASPFNYFFQTSTATAAITNGGGGTVTDKASSSMSAIVAGGSATALSPSITFTSSGTYAVRACADMTNSGTTSSTDAVNESNEGNNCGPWTDVVVSTAPVVPTVNLPTATAISQTAAILGANVSSLGFPSSISARGTCWGATVDPTTNCIPATGTTTGVYSHTRTGLSCGTTYHYRGYAINATGTGYSADSTFTTSACTTADLTITANIAPVTTTVGVAQTYTSVIQNIGNASTGSPFNYFFQTSTATAAITNGGGGTVTDKTSSSMSTLSASGSGTAVSPAITFAVAGTYAVRACADMTNRSTTTSTDSVNESNELNNCGPWTNVVVSTVAVPVVTLTVSPTSGTVGIVNPSLSWSATNSPTSCTASGDWTTNGAKPVSGTNVSQGILNTAKTYTYTLVCANTGGNSVAVSKTVVVSSALSIPTVTTTDVSNINANNATSGGSVTSDGGATVTVAGIVWSTSAISTTGAPTLPTKTENKNWSDYSAWADSFSSLTADTKYYVRAYATNSVGTAYGGQVSFTTSPVCSNPLAKNYPLCTVDSNGICLNGANNPVVCDKCTSPKIWDGASSSCITLASPLSISVNPKIYSVALPNRTVLATYNLNNGSNTDCRLLDYQSNPVAPGTYTPCTGSISVTAPAGANDYGYFVQAFKSSTGETVSDSFTVSVVSASDPINGSCAPTHNNCNYPVGGGINPSENALAYTWTCPGTGPGHTDASCSESKSGCVAGQGNPCISSLNSCGQYNAGTIQCDGSCSAVTPPDSSCVDLTCQDPLATNLNGPLPCTYPPSNVCQDPAATNFNSSLPCAYPPSGSCSNGATNPPLCTTDGGGGSCPTGYSGTYPDCFGPGGGSCPAGYSGTYPNCVGFGGGVCLVGYTGTYPNCVGPGGGVCLPGYTGVYPNCVGPTSGGGDGSYCLDGAMNPPACNRFRKQPIFIEN